ncbi:MAG: peptide MFS transporter [Bacteroidaceae bacterium]|nr:peptide MFS transporter [Bacteroidaceae bacterium]
MAERFSYYGMRALFTLYMINALCLSVEEAGGIYGTYTALVYLTPLIGGFIADCYWGTRRSILCGGLVMAVGHFLLFISASSLSDIELAKTLMFCGLGALIIGNGFFKPNISTMVGSLYPPEDNRKDAAFTIFYMGVNVGATLAPLLCGWLGNVDYRWGYLCACVAMLAGTAVMRFLQNRLLVTPDGQQIGLPPQKVSHQVSRVSSVHDEKKLSPSDRRHILVIFIIAFFVIFFWAAYEQAGVSLMVFAERNTDRNLFGWTMPAEWTQSLPAIFVVMLAPVFAALWETLSTHRIEPPAPVKQTIGLLFLALGYYVISIGVDGVTGEEKVSILWLVALYFLHVCGELCLAPIGLSLVNRLSPAHLASLMMGVWYMSTAASNALAGMLSSFYPHDGEVKHFLGYQIATLSDFFMLFVFMSGAAGILMLLACPKLSKMMK